MKIRVTINFEESGYSAYSNDVPDILLTAQGETIDELKKEMLEVIEEVKAMDEAPLILKQGYEVDWAFSVPAFLSKFEGIVSQSGLATLSGINPSLLSAYKSEQKKPSKAQVDKLQQAVNKFANELLSTPLTV
ncbi:hypothetical protein [Porphyromonas somerae]|uniref:type II toxin-antitoxin system HicB family antitoxin n=1 Tax=Porphyromonas somerae TaxID=322095 RepID=UPI001FCC2A19|nr:hypothetical protein [Porphyromonas somerae]BDE81296.1 hypothetical protein CE91St14_03240 [Porphyromonas somerae]